MSGLIKHEVEYWSKTNAMRSQRVKSCLKVGIMKCRMLRFDAFDFRDDGKHGAAARNAGWAISLSVPKVVGTWESWELGTCAGGNLKRTKGTG